MDQERLSLLALHFTPGIGSFLTKQLVSYCGSAEAVFQLPKGKLLKIPGIGVVTAESLKNKQAFKEAEKEFKKAEKEDTEILFFTDKKFPARLKVLDDSPAVLYVKGNVNLNAAKTVAIVGTRQATAYGKDQVEKIIEELVPHQALIISGLAYGIDIHAHKQALKHNLHTVGIMGSGMDVIYPAAHKDTAMKMIHAGGLITENAFGTKPDAHNFPARNRIIAGMCDALLVAEAALKGGALITAEIANTYNKDVFAIPGNLGNTYSDGCNKLIKINKAHLLTSVKDIEYIMGWNPEANITEQPTASDFRIFEPDELRVLTILKEKQAPVVIDELSYKIGLSPGVLASLLLTLEFKNAVQALPGKAYKIR